MSSSGTYNLNKGDRLLSATEAEQKAREIVSSIEFSQPTDLRPKLAALTTELLDDGFGPSSCTMVISSTADLVMQAGIQFALSELGPAPARWMYMVMGSEGRGEQTLRTDQDSAIVYAEGNHREYFVKLGEIVSRGLNGFGFLFCKGNVMASNPKWVMPLKDWKKAFSTWVEEPEPMAIMQACIFFDLRRGYGDPELSGALASHIKKLLEKQSGLFFYHMAQNALGHKVPLGWFGRLSRKASKSLDIKKTLLPFTDHARIYALSKGIAAQNTLVRIHKLDESGFYRGAGADEAVRVYEFLTRLRLLHQTEKIKRGEEPDNIINPSTLSEDDRNKLIHALKMSRDLQRNIEINFRAGY